MKPISRKWEDYLSEEEEEDYVVLMMAKRRRFTTADLAHAAAASIRHLDRTIGIKSTMLHQLETERFELLLRKEDEDKESKRELIDVRCAELEECIDSIKSELNTLKDKQSDAVENAENYLYNN